MEKKKKTELLAEGKKLKLRCLSGLSKNQLISYLNGDVGPHTKESCIKFKERVGFQAKKQPKKSKKKKKKKEKDFPRPSSTEAKENRRRRLEKILSKRGRKGKKRTKSMKIMKKSKKKGKQIRRSKRGKSLTLRRSKKKKKHSRRVKSEEDVLEISKSLLRKFRSNQAFYTWGKGIPPKGKDCLTRMQKGYGLRPLQRRVVEYILTDDSVHGGLLVAHGTGCGKTLAAATASQCYLDKYPKRKVIVVAPSSLVSPFREHIFRVHHAYHAKQYEFFSFTGLMKRFKEWKEDGKLFPSCENGMLIVDEAHNIRTKIMDGKGVKAEAVLELAKTAQKKLLLTATPFYNSPQDFVNLINILFAPQKVVETRKQRNTKGVAPISKKFDNQTIQALTNYLSGRVDYVPQCITDRGDFPHVRERYISVPMTESYQNKYLNATRKSGGKYGENPEAFWHAYRKAVNSIKGEEYFSSKIRKAIEEIKKVAGKGKKLPRTVFYSTWLEHGIHAVSKFLDEEEDKKCIKYTGKVSARSKADIVRRFNSGKIDCLLISGAGSEGLDLHGVRVLVVLDPVWNPAALSQIIGRAVRFQSHKKHDNKNVLILKMVLTFHGVTNWKDGLEYIRTEEGWKQKYGRNVARVTGDQMCYDIIRKKRNTQRRINRLLRLSSIEDNEPQVPLDL